MRRRKCGEVGGWLLEDMEEKRGESQLSLTLITSYCTLSPFPKTPSPID